MIKTLSPYSTTAKTAEIMSRYRLIAPKPESPANMDDSSSMSQKIRQSPYLRNLWPQLQARPTRTRKRGRAPISPPTATMKRPRTHILGFSPSGHVISSARHLSSQGFAHEISQISVPGFVGVNGLDNTVTVPSELVTLSLLPCQPTVSVVNKTTEIIAVETRKDVIIDLNTIADVPEEEDLLQQLQSPVLTSNVIAPQPVRPVGSSISVGCISEDPNSNSNSIPHLQIPKKSEELEEEIESEPLPAVICDSNYRVRLANSAYKEMVGQPECSWLDSTARLKGSSSKRICGEVMLNLADSRVPASSNKFSCWVNIEWGQAGKKKAVTSFCDVIRLSCESKDCLFVWRFHTNARKGSQCSTNA